MEGELPEGWVEVTLGDLGEWRGGGTPSKSNPGYWTNGTVPWVSPKDMKVDEIRTAEDSITIEAVARSATSLVPAGSLLVVVRSGILNRTLPVAISGAEVAVNQDIKALIPHGAVLPKFLAAYFHASESTILHGAAKSGTTVASIDLERLKRQSVPLPPLNEQRRIVARLEELTTRTKAARAALEAIPSLLDRFRQSVLAAAFRGDLTADWRAKNPDVEPTEDQAPSSDWGRDHESGRRRGRLWGSGQAAASVDVKWGDLPPTWRWRRIQELGEPDSVVQIGPMSMKSAEFGDSGHPVLNVGCVQWGRIDSSRCNFLSEERAREFNRYRLKEGDLVFTRSGTVGRCALLPKRLDEVLMTFHLLRIRPDHDMIAPEYLLHAISGCRAVRSQIDDSIIGATRAGFNTRLLQGLLVPVAPSAEQEVLLQRLRGLLAFEEEIRSQVGTVEPRLTTLHQSLLAKAFRGELVPQDPDDEPASVLLERIRQEREAAGGNGKSKRGRKAKQS